MWEWWNHILVRVVHYILITGTWAIFSDIFANEHETSVVQCIQIVSICPGSMQALLVAMCKCLLPRALWWHDKRDVTCRHPFTIAKWRRVARWIVTHEPILKSVTMLDHTLIMHLVDKHDMQIGFARVISGTWNFFHLMDISILNAYNMYQMTNMVNFVIRQLIFKY